MLERIATFTWQRPKLVFALIGVFVVLAAALGRDVEDHLEAAGFTDSDSESERATALLREELGYDANPGIVVLVRDPDGGRLDLRSNTVRREVGRIAEALAKAKHVGRVSNPLHDPRARRSLIAEDGRSLVIAAHLSTQDVESDGGEAAEDAKRRIASSPLEVGMGGFATSFNEVNDQVRSDLTTAELIAFPLLAVLLLIVFRGVVAAAIPLVIGVISILGAFLMLRVMAAFVDTSLFAENIVNGLSLGLAVDYALLLVSRYREELERLGPTREAHRRTVATAGRTVLFSGFTVAVALAGLIVFPQRFLYSLAVSGAAVGVLSSLIAVLVMARIKEQHDLGASNKQAVARGIGRTGRVISAAAVMIAVVFLAFTVSPVFFMKEIAVGQAVGVLIDATIVRALLVPSLMRLFGEWNWWAPAPLKRIQRRYGFQEA